jgi:hypothetical protein
MNVELGERPWKRSCNWQGHSFSQNMTINVEELEKCLSEEMVSVILSCFGSIWQGHKLTILDLETGREQLKDQIIRLQYAVISVFERARSDPYGIFNLDVADLLATSIGIRRGSTRALTDQYQRIEQARPIRRGGLSLYQERDERRRGRESTRENDYLRESEISIADWARDRAPAHVRRSPARSRSRQRDRPARSESPDLDGFWSGTGPAWVRRHDEVIIVPGRGRSKSRDRARVYMENAGYDHLNSNRDRF